MKSYKAFCKDKTTGDYLFIESEYPTLEAFTKDLRANGYTIVRAMLKATYDYKLDHTNM